MDQADNGMEAQADQKASGKIRWADNLKRILENWIEGARDRLNWRIFEGGGAKFTVDAIFCVIMTRGCMKRTPNS